MDLPLKWMDLVPKKLVWLILEIVRAPILLEKLFPVTFDCEAICEICLLASLVLTVEVWEVDLKKAVRFGGCLNKKIIYFSIEMFM